MNYSESRPDAQLQNSIVQKPPGRSTFPIAVNQYQVGKLPKDAPDVYWNALNSGFENKNFITEELIAAIRQGHPTTAICRGKRKEANFQKRQDLGTDFDTEDKRSSLDALQAIPFIENYARLLHTTTSHTLEKPRARAIFILSEAVTDPKRYREYAQAVNWFLGISDEKCKDPARLWFGSLNCDLRINGDGNNVLPIAVLDELVAQWKAAQPSAPPKPTAEISTTNAHESLNKAVRDGKVGNRNHAGFELAKRLRDAGYPISQAREFMLDYQAAVERIGNHPYLVREATDSLASAYSHKPRVDTILDALEDAVIAGDIQVSANVQKTLFGIIALMRKANKTKDIALSLRSVEHACFGFVDKSSVANHLAVLVQLGILQQKRKSNHRGGTQYSLIYDNLGHSQQGYSPYCLSVQDCRVSAQHYNELQAESICAINAQVHPLMARSDDELRHSFGSSGQRILATLQTLPDGVDSIETLAELTHLSARTVSRKVNHFAHHNIVDTTKIGTRLQVKLPKYWRENIEAITPALTSFGQDILRAQREAQQQIVHHEHMAKYTANPEEMVLSEATIERAQQRLRMLKAHKTEAYRQRQQWAQENGSNPAKAPPLSLSPRSNPKPRKPVIHVNGHDLTPGDTAKVKPNGLTKVERAALAESNHLQEIIERNEPAVVTKPVELAAWVRSLTDVSLWQKEIAAAHLSNDVEKRNAAIRLVRWLTGENVDTPTVVANADLLNPRLTHMVNWMAAS